MFGDNVYLLTNIFFVGEILGYTFSGLLSERWDPKQVLKYSLLLSSLFLILSNYFYETENLKYILFFLTVFIVSFSFNQYFIFAPSIFDINVRGMASSYNVVLGRFVSIFTSYIFSNLENSFLVLGVLYFINYHLVRKCKDSKVEEVGNNKSKSD